MKKLSLILVLACIVCLLSVSVSAIEISPATPITPSIEIPQATEIPVGTISSATGIDQDTINASIQAVQDKDIDTIKDIAGSYSDNVSTISSALGQYSTPSESIEVTSPQTGTSAVPALFTILFVACASVCYAGSRRKTA